MTSLLLFSDLSGNKELRNVIIDSFSSSSEEVKSAASFALGKLMSVNFHIYIFIFSFCDL